MKKILFFPLISLFFLFLSCNDTERSSTNILGAGAEPSLAVVIENHDPGIALVEENTILSSSYPFPSEEEMAAFYKTISKCDTIYRKDCRIDLDSPWGAGVTITIIPESGDTVRVRYHWPCNWEGVIINNDPDVMGHLAPYKFYRCFSSKEKLLEWQAARGPECYPE